MAHYRTKYEITAERDGRTFLIAYSGQVSRAGLLKAMQHRADAVIARLEIGADAEMTFACQPRVHATVCGWKIGFTGRTQIDARGSEYPYIAA